MRKYLFLLLVLLFISGCRCPYRNNSVAVKVNDYEITREEFEQEFRDSSFGTSDTLESRKDFLDNLISRQLILQDAQKKGLDKEKNFLKMIQKFWEQSLLKTTLDKKYKDIIDNLRASDEKMRPDTIKARESLAMDEWLAQLRKDSRIEINQELLTKDK